MIWQGARYEGLVTVQRVPGRSRGTISIARACGAARDRRARGARSDAGRARPPGDRPAHGVELQEEQRASRFRTARAVHAQLALPYSIMQQEGSQVAGRFAVSAIPPAPGGRSASALGGSQLAINARSDQPEAAYELIQYLTAPAQMLERAQVVGQLPTRRSLYITPELGRALAMDPAQAQSIIESAVVRPVTPVYAELSDILQVHLHRCLSDQESIDERCGVRTTRSTNCSSGSVSRAGRQPGRARLLTQTRTRRSAGGRSVATCAWRC